MRAWLCPLCPAARPCAPSAFQQDLAVARQAALALAVAAAASEKAGMAHGRELDVSFLCAPTRPRTGVLAPAPGTWRPRMSRSPGRKRTQFLSRARVLPRCPARSCREGVRRGPASPPPEGRLSRTGRGQPPLAALRPAPLGISWKSLTAGPCLGFPFRLSPFHSLLLALFLSCSEETREECLSLATG